MRQGKGFTLIELLIVIGILAVLAAAVVLVLNPAELLRQARDTTRISDLATLKSAITLYMATVSSPDLGACSGTRCTSGTCGAASTSTAVDGTGWIDINFSTMTGGSPLAALPLDPNNGASTCGGTTCRYLYACNETSPISFEINTNMESVRYGSGGQNDVESDDGGDTSGCYEVGTNLTLTSSC